MSDAGFEAPPERDGARTGAGHAPSGSSLGLLAVGVVAVSLSGPTMAAVAAPALAIAFWRNAFATVLLTPPTLLRRRREVAAMPAQAWRRTFFSGLALSLHFATWIGALSLTTVAASVAILSLQLAWVVGWEVLRGRGGGARSLVGPAVALSGVFVVTGVDLTLSTRALAGDLLALVGGIAAAVYMVVGAEVRRTVSTTTYTWAVYGTCGLLLLAACLLSGADLGGYDVRSWLLLGLVTLTAQLLGHSVFNHLLDRVSPTVVSLALLLEVPGSALLAAWWLGQRPSLGVLAGLVVILVGMAMTLLHRRAPGAPT